MGSSILRDILKWLHLSATSTVHGALCITDSIIIYTINEQYAVIASYSWLLCYYGCCESRVVYSRARARSISDLLFGFAHALSLIVYKKRIIPLDFRLSQPAACFY